MATDSELKAEKIEKARKANQDRIDARLAMMERIADGSDEAHKNEMTDTPDGGLELREPANNLNLDEPEPEEAVQPEAALPEEPVAPVAEDAAPEPELESQPEESPEPEDTDEKTVNGVRYYLTIVNGQERWLTKSQLIEKAQKVESADEYLKNAAESARTLTRTDPSLEDDTVSVEEDDMEKALSSAVLGDQEAVKKVASALSDLRKQLAEAKKSQPSVTPDVVKEIDNRFAFRNAVEWFNIEFSKELADPKLKKLMYDRDQELAQTDPNLPYKERLKKAGEEVRSWINGQKGVQAKPNLEKLERKKALPQVPAPASQRQTPPVDEEETETVESAIQAMAKARGQPRAIVHRR